MNKISIIVPVYNALSWLQKCFDSIQAQTYTNYELILVDDGSTDGSGVLCDSLASSDSRTRVIHQKNYGVSAARNLGLSAAIGDWIAFIDADDYVHRKYIEFLLNLCMRYDCDVVQCRQMRTKEFDESLFGLEIDDIVLYTGQQMHWGLCGRGGTRSMLWCKLFRKSLFDNVRFPHGLIHEDEAVMHHVLANAHRMAFTTSKFYYYHTVPSSIMNQKLSTKRLDLIPILTERRTFYQQRGWIMLYLATAQRYAMDIMTLYRGFYTEDNTSVDILSTLRNAYRENWSHLKLSPLLNTDMKRLHMLWLDEPMAEELYQFWTYLATFDDDTLALFEQEFIRHNEEGSQQKSFEQKD